MSTLERVETGKYKEGKLPRSNEKGLESCLPGQMWSREKYVFKCNSKRQSQMWSDEDWKENVKKWSRFYWLTVHKD